MGTSRCEQVLKQSFDMPEEVVMVNINDVTSLCKINPKLNLDKSLGR